MSLDALQYRENILREFGDVDNATVALELPFVWDLYAAEAAGDIYLQWLLARRHLLGIMVASVAGDSDYQVTDVKESASEKGKGWADLFKTVQGLIDQYRKRKNAAATPVLGTLTRTAPLMPTAPALDPNGSAYRGDPLTARRGPF